MNMLYAMQAGHPGRFFKIGSDYEVSSESWEDRSIPVCAAFIFPACRHAWVMEGGGEDPDADRGDGCGRLSRTGHALPGGDGRGSLKLPAAGRKNADRHLRMTHLKQ